MFPGVQKWNIDEKWVKVRKRAEQKSHSSFPAVIYLLKFNNRNTRTKSEIYSKLALKTPERRQWYRSGVFIVNFEHISHFILVFL